MSFGYPLKTDYLIGTFLKRSCLHLLTMSNTTSTYLNQTDEHTLAIKVHPVVTQEQLRDALRDGFKQARDIDSKYQTMFIINMVKKNRVRTGRAFVWVSNPCVYHMILGRNPDGSHRIITYEDPDWVPPEDNSDDPIPLGSSWADIMDEEEAKQCPLIEEQQPPLITIPTIKLTPEQQNEHEEKPTEIKPRIEAALAHDVSSDYNHNVLRSSALLSHMDEKFIRNEFVMYSTSKGTLNVRKGRGKGEVSEEPYPYVKIVEHSTPRGKERVAYVTFDAATRDASFAFHMMRHREYTNKKTGEVFIVNYTYAKSRP